MDEMFDVFDDNAQSGSERNGKSHGAAKKRLASGQAKPSTPSDIEHSNEGSLEGTPDAKRRKRESSSDSSSGSDGEDGEIEENSPAQNGHQSRRKAEPEPIVADAFEQEESREVQASAGLQAQKEGTNVVLSHQVRHQVALPPNYDYIPLSRHKPPADPARTWPFTLDPFQQVAVASIQRNESVLVSAHTSAGKTVCAEYAIAQCLKNNQRVIYTSPIKALSNQKYREFNQEFGDVGLMTGDVTINPEATCLVMTTEILRSMLYRGSEVLREVGWVIFDEVHYLRDPSRGVVWEETIILLPDKVRYVFLSATIPNAMQFAEWIVKTHNQPCHVVYTDFRPTPLQHYLFPAGADGIHLVVDEKGVFREENFAKAMAAIAEAQGDDPADPNARRKGRGKDKRFNKGRPNSGDIYKIVKMIMQKSYNPVIVFSFSKRECEQYALQMSSLTFNDDDEKAMVGKVFENALDMLSATDKQLPQIQHILPLLRRGIGIHHSGLLPILKETIEILFQEGLLKVLFATETFSIGLNMPAKTVVFTSVRKFDGKTQRWVTPSEFIQMSGRAGRRGLDERGIVIMMIDEKMEPAVGQEIVRGQQDNLNSAFHLGYNMILNLMRVEGISPEFMLEHCFKQFQSTASVSGLEKELHQLEDERHHMHVEDESTIKEYYDIRKNLDEHIADMKAIITHPNYCLPFMQPGRLIHVSYEGQDFGWAVVVNYKKAPGPGFHQKKPQEQYIVHALVKVASGNTSWTPAKDGEPSKMDVVPMTLNCIESIGHLRLFLPKDVKNEEAKRQVLQSLNEVKRRFPDGIANLDPIENMNIEDASFKKLVRKIEVRESRLFANPLHNSPRLPDLYSQYSRKVAVGDRIKAVRRQISDALSVIELDELKNRKRVLRRLGFINDAEVVQLKARVACEISTGDELVLSELLFDRFFNELSPEHCAALLSCFVFEEKAEDKGNMRDDLLRPFRQIQARAREVAKVAQESKLDLNEEGYVQSFKPAIMEVVFRWAKGATFAEIVKMTDVYEGSLIRIFRRLQELLRQMALAAKVMGSEDLEKKFEDSLNLLNRDIVAAQSLYL